MPDFTMGLATTRAADIDGSIFGFNSYDTADFRVGYRAGLGDTIAAGNAGGAGAALAFVNNTIAASNAGTYVVPSPVPGQPPSVDYKLGYRAALADCSAAAAAGAPPPAPATSDEPDGQTAPPPPANVPITSP